MPFTFPAPPHGHRRRDAVTPVPELVGDVRSTIAWAAGVGLSAPRPGEGETAELWGMLADVAAADVGVARVLEPHLDALAILSQAGVTFDEVEADESSSWGVFAAEAPGATLTARRVDGYWRLHGRKAWCSLAQDLSHALVTAHVEEGPLDLDWDTEGVLADRPAVTRGLFAVRLGDAGVSAHPGPWPARGLSWIVSAPVDFDDVRAVAVGEPGWYLTRPGFAWGGMSVAACWYGGAVGVARSLARRSDRAKRAPGPHHLAHLGAADVALHSASATLARAAAWVDSGSAPDGGFGLLAARVRGAAASAVDDTLLHAARALGPAPLALDADHARRVADLQLYVRQHHAEADDAAIGKMLWERGEMPW